MHSIVLWVLGQSLQLHTAQIPDRFLLTCVVICVLSLHYSAQIQHSTTCVLHYTAVTHLETGDVRLQFTCFCHQLGIAVSCPFQQHPHQGILFDLVPLGGTKVELMARQTFYPAS